MDHPQAPRRPHMWTKEPSREKAGTSVRVGLIANGLDYSSRDDEAYHSFGLSFYQELSREIDQINKRADAEGKVVLDLEVELDEGTAAIIYALAEPNEKYEEQLATYLVNKANYDNELIRYNEAVKLYEVQLKAWDLYNKVLHSESKAAVEQAKLTAAAAAKAYIKDATGPSVID